MNAIRRRIRGFLEGLEPRERLLVGSAAALAVLSLLYLLVVVPLRNAVTWSDARLEQSEQALMQADRLLRKYEKVHTDLAAVEEAVQNGPRGNLLTTLESLATASKVKVNSMQPQAGASNEQYRETRVQIELKEVGLSQLVKYLFEIEAAPQHISVKTLRIRTLSNKPGMLDATFSVSSFAPV